MTDITDEALVEVEIPEPEPDELTRHEQADLVEAEDQPAAVVYSGQDFDIEGLVRRMKNEDILVPTFGHSDDRISSAGFQRAFVWNRPQMDRFVESLLLGYPIPGVFFVRQRDKRYLVLDGQQRLRTLQHFYAGVYGGKVFALQNVGEAFKGLRYETLSDEQRRTLDNAFIQATIVETDGTSASLESVYQIFERLNAGGTQLTPHEIRVALYAGPFIDFLERLNQDAAWRTLYGKVSPRVRDQELILRILALFETSLEYSRPLKSFLNQYVSRRRDMSGVGETLLLERFSLAAALLLNGPGRSAVRPRGNQVNAALTEALFVGLMWRLDDGDEPSEDAVTNAVADLLTNDKMQEAISRSTADEESVKVRLRESRSAFSGSNDVE